MVTIKKADKEVDASRLLSLMGLGVRCNDEVMVRIEGGNEDAAYDDMKQYFEGIIEGIDDNYLGKYYRKEHIKGGYIKKYIAVLDAEKLNQGFVVFCSVKLRRLNRDIAAEFTRIIQDIPEVTECYNISGSYDYLLKIHAPNMKYYQEFILNVLGTIDSLGSLESTFVMAEVKHRYGIHI